MGKTSQLYPRHDVVRHVRKDPEMAKKDKIVSSRGESATIEKAPTLRQRVDKLEEAVKSLGSVARQNHCKASGGHYWVYQTYKDIGYGTRVFMFTCKCGAKVAKQADGLTSAEHKALKALGL